MESFKDSPTALAMNIKRTILENFMTCCDILAHENHPLKYLAHVTEHAMIFSLNKRQKFVWQSVQKSGLINFIFLLLTLMSYRENRQMLLVIVMTPHASFSPTASSSV